MKSLSAKVVVVGAQGVGKTSLVQRFECNTFSSRTSSTIGASFSNVSVVSGDTKVNLQVWDTAGQERFRSLAPMFYRGSDAAILVFDITKQESFVDAKTWALELRNRAGPDVVFCLVGNKCDLEEQRTVSRDAAQCYADKEDAHYFETSAFNNTGVKETFAWLAEEVVAARELKAASANKVPLGTSFGEETVTLQAPSSRREGRCC